MHNAIALWKNTMPGANDQGAAQLCHLPAGDLR